MRPFFAPACARMERDKGLNPKPEPGFRNPNSFLVITMKTHIHLPAFRLATAPNKSVARAALPSPRPLARTSVLHSLASVLGLLPAVLCLLAASPQDGATTIVKVAAGASHSLYLTDEGNLYGMGANNNGQLGVSGTDDRLTPVLIASNVIDMAAGYTHSLFVKNDGTLWAMGNNDYGQLGNGLRYVSSLSPVQIATGVKTVAAGETSSFFVKSDGTLWAMGRDAYQQLAGLYGGSIDPVIPAPQQADTDVTGMAAGRDHSLIVKSDGRLYAWGCNDNGQLGNGTTNINNTYAQLTTNGATVAAGDSHSLYVTRDGKLYAMGLGKNGQLGFNAGTYLNYRCSTPQQVTTTSSVAAISAGYAHSMFTTTDGKLYTMGYNYYGQLGDGTATTATTTTTTITTNMRQVN